MEQSTETTWGKGADQIRIVARNLDRHPHACAETPGWPYHASSQTMTSLALTLVLASAFAHATWNLLAKRAGGSLTFTWLFHVVATVLCAPIAGLLILTEQPTFGLRELTAVIGSGLLHVVYFLLLGQGYKLGDLSVVYPLARGTGPMLAALAAIVLFGERPTSIALVGILLVGVGVVVLTGDPTKLQGAGRSVAFALATGVMIALYTLWDKWAVSSVGIAPILYFWGFFATTGLLLTPIVVRRWDAVRAEWKLHWRAALGTGALIPLAYVLVLTALATSPVSYVAPTREIGILIGTVMGTRLLAEGRSARRLAGAGAMVIGVVLLALG